MVAGIHQGIEIIWFSRIRLASFGVSRKRPATLNCMEEAVDGTDRPAMFRAAQYVRMSTEHQQYSTHNQSDNIREYAEKRGIEIIKTYADEGKSGLSIGGRAAHQMHHMMLARGLNPH